jgi:6-phosphogluconolactonase (cycloisomerase 2 family)
MLRRTLGGAAVVLFAAMCTATGAAHGVTSDNAPVTSPVAGSPFASGYAPNSVAFSPSGDLLAAADSGGGTISTFNVSATGQLSPVSGSPFANANVVSVAFSPSGTLLAAADESANAVSVFAVSSTGQLTAVQGSPFSTGVGTDLAFDSEPVLVQFSPDGDLLAVADEGNGTVSVFTVSASGQLTPASGSPYETADFPTSVAFSPNGHLLAVVALGRSLSVFTVDASGALSAAAGSPYETGATPLSVTFAPSGNILAVADSGAHAIATYTVAASGQLTAVAAGLTENGPSSVAFNPSGDLIASANSAANTVSEFVVAPSGQLTPVGGSPFSTGADPTSVAFSPTGTLLAVANGNGDSVSMFTNPRNPTIVANESSTSPKTTYGWYRTAVTVSFTCSPGSARLSPPCPVPATLSHNGAAQYLKRTIYATDGGTATLIVYPINIDRVRPQLTVIGATDGGTYPKTRRLRCKATDALSGLASCNLKVHHTRHGDTTKIAYTANAADKAGNTRTVTGYYKIHK